MQQVFHFILSIPVTPDFNNTMSHLFEPLLTACLIFWFLLTVSSSQFRLYHASQNTSILYSLISKYINTKILSHNSNLVLWEKCPYYDPTNIIFIITLTITFKINISRTYRGAIHRNWSRTCRREVHYMSKWYLCKYPHRIKTE